MTSTTIRSQRSRSGTAKTTTTPTPVFKQGDIVKLPFPYTDQAAEKYRPALVVSLGNIGKNGELIWVVMITSDSPGKVPQPGDLKITAFTAAGLPFPSIIRPVKIATYDAVRATQVGSISGQLLSAALQAVFSNLK
jgi:mRNA interferase MazF